MPPSSAIALETNTLYEFGSFLFDPADHLLLFHGVPVPLTPKAFDILLVLVQNPNRLTTKETLLSKVWPDSFVEEANLTVNISALRKVLGGTPEGLQYIETVPKKGYRFAVPVTELRCDSPQGPSEPLSLNAESCTVAASSLENPPATNQTAAKEHPKPRNRAAALALGVSLFIILALSYFAFRSHIALAQPSGHARRLAVLPFQNLRENAADDFLGLSLANAVVTKLDSVSELAVRSSYAVQKYKNQNIDISRVAADLNVDTLLTGAFLHDHNDLRISAQLIDVQTQDILWKGACDLKYENLLTVQDIVSRQIVRGLQLTLSPSEAARLRRDDVVNPVAYEYYLRGVDLYSKNDFPVAITMLQKSAELAPNYAPVWASLGRSHTANASFQFGGAEQYQKAQLAFERSLSLQPDQIDARIYMANMFTDTGRVEKAVPLLRGALQTNPNHAEIHWELGYAYRFAGMLQQSVSESERARQLDPGVKLNSSTLNAYLYLAQYDNFLSSLPGTDDAALIVFYRGLAEYYKKNYALAALDFDHAFALDRSLLQAQIGKAFSFAIHHQDSDAEALLHSVETKIDERQVGDPEAIYKIAQAYAAFGDKPAAMRVLKQSIDAGFFPYPYFASDPLINSLHDEPEFSALLNAARQRYESFHSAFF